MNLFKTLIFNLSVTTNQLQGGKVHLVAHCAVAPPCTAQCPCCSTALLLTSPRNFWATGVGPGLETTKYEVIRFKTSIKMNSSTSL